jgi:hypothetical protein
MTEPVSDEQLAGIREHFQNIHNGDGAESVTAQMSLAVDIEMLLDAQDRLRAENERLHDDSDRLRAEFEWWRERVNAARAALAAGIKSGIRR